MKEGEKECVHSEHAVLEKGKKTKHTIHVYIHVQVLRMPWDANLQQRGF